MSADPLAQIRMGTAGWSYRDWQDVVYPAQLKKSEHPVEYLARYFDLIEINTSFYGHIKPDLGRSWSRKAAGVNPRFVFTAKLNKTFTHSPIATIESTSAATIKPNPEDEKLAKAGLDSIAEEGRLGALLAQFPVSFKNTDANREYLEWLLERFKSYPMAVEVRHLTWNEPEVLRYFAQKGAAFVNIDQPRLGLSMTGTEHVTSAMAYIRLHGRNYEQWFQSERSQDRYNYLYTEQELTGWKDKIERVAKKANVTFVVANNHFQGKAAVNVLQLKHMITGAPVKAPEILVRSYPAELGPISETRSARLL
jgi:uncharacterized protein YecE (DUF72 family)